LRFLIRNHNLIAKAVRMQTSRRTTHCLQEMPMLHPIDAAIVLQSATRGRTIRRCMKSPFFRAAIRAGWRALPPAHGR